MVKVVSRPEAKRTTCYNCKCVLEYGFHDVRSNQHYYYDGSETYHYIVCPNCEKQHTVEWD